MINTVYIPVLRWRQLPPLFCLSFGALLGLAITTFVLGERSAQKSEELIHEYGTTLASLTAQASTDATLNHDLVSLHAVLQDIVALPRVSLATVHDVDNSLLVQAGQAPRFDAVSETFTSVIPFQDDVAGRVALTLNATFPGEEAVKWTLAGTALLLMLMSALSMYEARGEAWYLRRRQLFNKDAEHGLATIDGFEGDLSLDNPAPPDTTREDDSPGGLDDGDSNGESAGGSAVANDLERGADLPVHSDLVIALPNRKRLQQQLSGDMFQQLCDRFECTLDDVLTLYGGANVGAPEAEGIYCVRFGSWENQAEATFRALCAAYLVQTLSLHGKIRFHVLAEICGAEFDVKLAVKDCGVFIQADLLDDLLRGRLQLSDMGDGRLSLQGFNAPFADLLERQQEQLRMDA